MQENEQNDVEQGPVNNQYIDAINDLKKTTVPKDDYEQLKAENAKLLKSLIDGSGIAQASSNDEPASADELRTILFDGRQLTNLEGWTAALALRERLLLDGQRDPFTDYHVDPKNNDLEAADKAQRVADIVKECIDYAQGDSELFTQELARRTVDYKMRK